MHYLVIDGDDVGQKLAACYLSNDFDSLIKIKEIIDQKTQSVSKMLRERQYQILFCAADGVTACSDECLLDDSELFNSVSEVAGKELTFSVGVGRTLREAYIALLYAKSTGKSRIVNFKSMDAACSG